MSSSGMPSPRSANSSPAASRIRIRLRSASLRSGFSAGAMGAIAHTVAGNGGADSSYCYGLSIKVETKPPFTSESFDMPPHENPHHARRWAILAVLGIAQLMVVLDATIVNIALPSAQDALGFSDDSRQWIVTAYALAFGSLLLLGGRLGDLFGRKWTFIAGLIGFAGASAIGGAAQSFGMLVAARALQGMFGAVLAPSALGLLTTTFLDPDERGKAFGIFGAIAGGGAALGLLLGGILTEALSWRWCLYVNLLFAIPAAVCAFGLLVNQPNPNRPKIDIPGVLSVTAGLFGLVFGFSSAETHGWDDPLTMIALAA